MAIPFSITLAAAPCLLMEPNGVDSRPDQLLVQGQAIAAQASGAGLLDKDSRLPSNRHEYEFVCVDRVELKALQDFFDARQGRAQPFWFPTRETEHDLAPTYTGGSFVWLKASSGFGSVLFPLGNAYRRLLSLRGDVYAAYLATAITPNDPGGSGFEKVAISNTNGDFSSVATPWAESNGVQLFSLRYGRFDTDTFSVEYAGSDGGGVVTLAMVELPDEIAP
jgi:hypothetical protein